MMYGKTEEDCAKAWNARVAAPDTSAEAVAWLEVAIDGKIRTTHKPATAEMWRNIHGSKVHALGYIQPSGDGNACR